jgi:transposase-like protein
MKTLSSFDSVLAFTDHFNNESKCVKYLESILWAGGEPVCPHCGNAGKIYKFAYKNKYKCAECSKQFKATAKTMFEGTHIPLKTWFIGIYLVAYHNKGMSSVQLAKYLHVTQKTAWFLGHRIRQAQKENLLPFKNDTEVDESYFGGSQKGKRGRGAKNKQPVVGIVERKGKVSLKPVANASAEVLEAEILKCVDADARVITDSWLGYANVHKTHKNHDRVNHDKEFANGDIHTNTIEGVWSNFKRTLNGVYHSVSKKHLNRYCIDFCQRYNTREQGAQEKFDGILNNVFGRRIKYAELIAK